MWRENAGDVDFAGNFGPMADGDQRRFSGRLLHCGGVFLQKKRLKFGVGSVLKHVK